MGTLTGTGTVDEAVTSGTFQLSLKAGGGLIHDTWTGDVCTTSSHKLPLGLGNIVFKGLSCPLAAGPASLPLDVSISSSVPSSLATADIALTASAKNDKLICMNVHLQKTGEIETSIIV